MNGKLEDAQTKAVAKPPLYVYGENGTIDKLGEYSKFQKGFESQIEASLPLLDYSKVGQAARSSGCRTATI
jgi:hypothetical protein